MYWLPPLYSQDSPSPLIFSFHGVGQTPTKQADLDLLGDTFFNTGQIVVYPQASLPDGEKKVIWQGPPDAEVDDVSFVMDLIDELEANLCIDTRRIYATGKSEGGGFVGTLACNATSAARIAAFAPVSGAFYIDADCDDPSTVTIPCDPGRCNVPIIEFHGGADFLVSIDGGERRSACLPSIQHYMQNWAELDGLNSTPVQVYNITTAATISKYDDAGTVTFVYDGDDVEHDWPFTIPTADTAMDGGDPATFNATSIILDWFGNFTLPYNPYSPIAQYCGT
jgi:poly(3-hydroxybutyrate) depolymerase